MKLNIFYLAIFFIGNIFSMELRKQTLSQLNDLKENQLYGSTLALTKRPIATESGEWKCPLNHLNHSKCVKMHKNNVKSGNYILALLAVLNKSYDFTGKEIIGYEEPIVDFMIKQPGIQEEIANRIVHKEIIIGNFKKNGGSKDLPECIEETFRSFKQDTADKNLYYLDTRPIEEFFLNHYEQEIAQKRKDLIEKKKKNHDICKKSELCQETLSSPWQESSNFRLINNCQWCSDHYDGKIKLKKMKINIPQGAITQKTVDEKPKSIFNRLTTKFNNWYSGRLIQW